MEMKKVKRKFKECYMCDGGGLVYPGYIAKKCPTCNGTGKIATPPQKKRVKIEQIENKTYPEFIIPGEEIIDIKSKINELIEVVLDHINSHE